MSKSSNEMDEISFMECTVFSMKQIFHLILSVCEIARLSGDLPLRGRVCGGLHSSQNTAVKQSR